MSNALYNKWKQQIITDRLSTANIKAVLVNTAGTGTLYVFSQAHEFLSDVPAASRIATSGNLASKTFVNGVLDAADLVPAFASATGTQSEVIILYEDTGVATTSRLILFLDTATGLAITPDGNNIDINWNAGGIFVL